MKIYVYKMVVDNEGAPCVSKGLLSLAICKPMIRKMAEGGSLIFGFGGKSYEQRLIYIASVTSKLRCEYYRQPEYSKRRDCIYREVNGEAEIRSDARYHKSGDQLKHDVGSNFERADVLLSKDFRYLGKCGTADYQNNFQKINELVNGLKRGHRVNHSLAVHAELIELKNQIWKKYSDNFSGESSDSDLTKVCNKQSGSCEIYAPV